MNHQYSSLRQRIETEGYQSQSLPYRIFEQFAKSSSHKWLMRAVDAGGDTLCSGHDYRQALEIAIALKQFAHRGHGRISVPLEDHFLKIYPHPYRLKGGDLAVWQSIGYTGPPSVA